MTKKSKAVMLVGVFVAIAIVVGTVVVVLFNRPATDHDIRIHPELLLDHNFAFADLTLGGIRVGDPESAIAESRISNHKSEYGWITCKDGNRYRIDDGKVAVLMLELPMSSNRIGISSKADIIDKFGEPDFIGGYPDYNFADRHLLIAFDETHQLTQFSIMLKRPQR